MSTEKKLKRPVYYVSIALDDPALATEMPDPSTDEPPKQKKAKYIHRSDGTTSTSTTSKFTNVITTLAKKLFDNQNRATVLAVHPRSTEEEINLILAHLYDNTRTTILAYL